MSRKFFFAAVILVAVVCFFTFNTIHVSRAQTGGAALPTLGLANTIGGFTSPVGIAHAGDGTGRLFVVEQGGRIRIVKNGALLTTPFLDISTRISSGGERGLLGLAFPPDYATKGHFYVNYTNPAGDTVVARFLRSASNADTADPASEQRVILIGQPFANHNGGQLNFSPRDGQLYVGMGDGGSGGDPGNRAQNPADLLGKILRLDVESGRPYAYTVPASNPFVNRTGFRPEIWALGMRNPWRFTFDRLTADLFMADVGQGSFEEIDFQTGQSAGGENYGWRIMEGIHCFNPNPCTQTGLTLPIHEYDHGAGDCSVTGGYVYRAQQFPRMQGLYLYGDFCSGRIWGLRFENNAWTNALLLDNSFQISAFGEDEAGNVYVAAYNTGQIHTLVDNGPAATPSPTPVPASVRFSSPVGNTTEGAGSALVGVTRLGDTSGELFVDYATSDDTASSRKDYTTARGTLRFAPGETLVLFSVLISNDDTQEAGETVGLTLSNLRGKATLAQPPVAVLTIADDDPATSATNPLDRSDFYVRQHYLDFLNREPDTAGLNFWINNIESCGQDSQCRVVKRVDTSAAFFLSIEFQETGFLVYRMHKAAFGNLTGTPIPVRFNEFLADTQEIGRGVVIGSANAQAQLEQNKVSFSNNFVARASFVSRYATGQTPAQYVAALNANAGLVLTQAEVDDFAARLADGRETRASVLRKIAEDADFESAEFNRAFVLMQYFGYLRRDPDSAPDTDFVGYNFWLGKLDSFGGDFRRADMVKAFIESAEYRGRFVP
ncbi:MAG: PQQ-dependent sugar dehydrogenase [Rubrivivax sp.]|nr:PQQ-dependent sugar dehydrogenase [Pyrinomonadaceae bacterium]